MSLRCLNVLLVLPIVMASASRVLGANAASRGSMRRKRGPEVLGGVRVDAVARVRR